MNIDEMLFKIDNAKRLKKTLKAIKKLGGSCEIKSMEDDTIDFRVSFKQASSSRSIIGFHP